MEVSLAYAIDKKPEYLTAAKAWTLAAIDYEPWGYTYNKPNTDLAAGHLLYAIGWAYDLLYDDFTAAERARIRASLERHAGLVYDAFAPRPKRQFTFTQNHTFIPTSGLAVTALALMGESKDAEKWAALARAHHVRAGQLLSPDGYYYEGFEYWIFSTPWLVHFLDAWEHSTGENLWNRDVFRNWKTYLAHTLLPDGQNVFDFGDIWEGALTRAKTGAEYPRVYPGGTLQSNFNVMYRVAATSQGSAGAGDCRALRLVRSQQSRRVLDAAVARSVAEAGGDGLRSRCPTTSRIPASSTRDRRGTKARPRSRSRRVRPKAIASPRLLPKLPEWRLDSGHAHPDAGSFIVWANGRYLTGDTGYAGLPSARNHNTMTFGGIGQGVESQHDVWREMDYRALDGIRIREADLAGGTCESSPISPRPIPPSAGVSTFTRTFTWDGGSTITVADTVALQSPRPAEWFLQSDTAFSGKATTFTNGRAGEPALRVSFVSPAVTVTTGQASVRAPGPPGSIEKGVEEPRGYVLTAKAPAAPRSDSTSGSTGSRRTKTLRRRRCPPPGWSPRPFSQTRGTGLRSPHADSRIACSARRTATRATGAR